MTILTIDEKKMLIHYYCGLGLVFRVRLLFLWAPPLCKMASG